MWLWFWNLTNLIDFVAIIPFYIEMWSSGDVGSLAVLRVLRIVRLQFKAFLYMRVLPFTHRAEDETLHVAARNRNQTRFALHCYWWLDTTHLSPNLICCSRSLTRICCGYLIKGLENPIVSSVCHSFFLRIQNASNPVSLGVSWPTAKLSYSDAYVYSFALCTKHSLVSIYLSI